MEKSRDSIFQFLGSLKLSVPLLFLIAAVAITGTLIPQGLTSEEYRRVFSPAVFTILDRLQIFDVYHSIWFTALLALFAINLILCSCRRFPAIWKSARSRATPWPEKPSERVLQYDFQTSARPEPEIHAILNAILGRRFAPPEKISAGGTLCFFAQKGRWSRLAVFVTHLSILVILAGALVGSLWGFKAFVAIPEGQTVEKVRSNRDGEIIPLGFTVRCDDFSVEYYGNSQRPKEFTSLVSIVDAGDIVVNRQAITVNHPLFYRGIAFYQSSFGPASDPTLRIRVRPRGTDEELDFSVSSGEKIPLPDGNFFRVLRFTPSLRDLGPVALLEVSPASGEAFVLPIFQGFPDMSEAHSQGPYRFSLAGFDQSYYTGLMVNRDPGVWFVWTGFILLTAGLLMAFTVSHRRIWISVTPGENLSQLSIRGVSQRNPVAFERFFRDLSRALETGLSPGKVDSRNNGPSGP